MNLSNISEFPESHINGTSEKNFIMIPFNDFRLHYKSHRTEYDQVIRTVLESGWYILGNQLEQFEQEFARYTGTTYCVGVASGTEAIALSLMASGIKNGDEVITTDVTAFPTIAGIVQGGAKPVVVDIDPESGLIDSARIESKINSRTRALVPVHLYGQCCDMDLILRLAKVYNLLIVEDAAQAVGSTYTGKKAGSFGDCAIFSFYPTKNLGAFGDAGAVMTNSKELYTMLLQLRNYGQRERYHHDETGINSRLDEIQAAILRVKLNYIDEWNQRRQTIAAYYRSNLKTTACLKQNDRCVSNNHLFVVQHPKRDLFMQYLKERSIQTLIHYPIPVHRQKAFPYQKQERFQNSIAFTESIFSLPLYPELTDDQVNMIVEVVNEFKG